MLNRGNFFRTAMASPRFKGCATQIKKDSGSAQEPLRRP
jgi:hypothetical protein